jgi:hypothetical protein
LKGPDHRLRGPPPGEDTVRCHHDRMRIGPSTEVLDQGITISWTLVLVAPRWRQGPSVRRCPRSDGLSRRVSLANRMVRQLIRQGSICGLFVGQFEQRRSTPSPVPADGIGDDVRPRQGQVDDELISHRVRHSRLSMCTTCLGRHSITPCPREPRLSCTRYLPRPRGSNGIHCR